MEIIERIKKRSDATKRRYAFSVAVFVTLVIGVGWATTLPTRFSDISFEMGNNTSVTDSGFDELIKDSALQLGNVTGSLEEPTVIPEPQSVSDAIQETAPIGSDLSASNQESKPTPSPTPERDAVTPSNIILQPAEVIPPSGSDGE